MSSMISAAKKHEDGDARCRRYDRRLLDPGRMRGVQCQTFPSCSKICFCRTKTLLTGKPRLSHAPFLAE